MMRRLPRLVRSVGVGLLLAGLAGCASVPVAPSGPIGAVALDRATAEQAVSAYRRAHGLSAVELDPALTAVAQRQADAMAAANLLSHEVAGALPARLAANGADRRAAVENVSAGYPSFAAALGGWQRSPHHNDNLLFPPMRRMGIAAASAPGTRYKTFWSLVMTN
ncbi:CAP domain-containing protein [Lichenihabitans sp. Uapishka_5]|uniref:CAP domain-containing protein n=1 Tax=Lichenihabitans sp. Uapishka_5 TaxID=3037302 RepID=UPI0029E7D99F|nr:CAP domain-containing protein [Lichenihabitans sp. Uapishka_5]MDX7952998.1 CAP domain-containing protein [Lichenihabitans sp. Uapishka_5]